VIMNWENNESLLIWVALFFSLLIHASLFVLGSSPFRIEFRSSRRTVEIDLTHSARLDGSKEKAVSTKSALPTKPKEWIVPKKGKELAQPFYPPAPSTVEERPAEVPSSEDGASDGFMDVTRVSRFPQVLNLAELESSLKRFYPEDERLKRNEGTVVLVLHVDEQGRVVSADAIRSPSSSFAEAAIKVARLIKFKPAMVGRNPVAVKLKQAIRFKLEE